MHAGQLETCSFDLRGISFWKCFNTLKGVIDPSHMPRMNPQKWLWRKEMVKVMCFVVLSTRKKGRSKSCTWDGICRRSFRVPSRFHPGQTKPVRVGFVHWSSGPAGRRAGGKSIGRKGSLIGWPMGEPEFLRIPNLRNLTYLTSPSTPTSPNTDGGSELPCHSDPRHPPQAPQGVPRPCWRGPACDRRARSPAREMAPCNSPRYVFAGLLAVPIYAIA